jgi:hypothetical protein
MVDEEARKLAKYASQFKGGSKKHKERINDAEKKEAIVLMRRLNDFFAKKHSNIQLILSPIFPGCGKIDDCEGDVLVSTVLYEIKAGDRNFRLIDIKQVLTYCALNYAVQRYKIEKIGLINPRKGVFFLQPLDQLARGLAGTTPSQILSDIMDFISQSFSSR